MSDWEDEEPSAAFQNYSGSTNSISSRGGDNHRSDYNNRNGRNGRDQSGDRHNRGQSNDRWRNDRYDGGDAISFEIDHRHVGMVIGRGGCKIKEIQEKYNVNLNIDKNQNEHGKSNITIRGGSPDMNDARKYIERLVGENSNGFGGNGGDRQRSQWQAHGSDQNRDGGQSNSSSNSRVIEIDHSNVGLIIGRGGSKIRELEEKFKVVLKIDRNSNANGRATVSIRGDTRDIDQVTSEIEELTKERQGSGGFDRPRDEPKPMETAAAPTDFELIDWQAAARESEEENKKRWAKLPPLKKDFYEEHADVTNMSPERVAAIREENNKTTVNRLVTDDKVTCPPIPNPITKFDECFEAYPDLLEEIKKQGFEKPSPIQSQAWPVLLRGEDLIGIAQTGTGKTLAFLLPAMIHTEYQSVPRGERGGPNVLVLAPTRELALQIEKEVGKYQFRGMKAVCVYGGGDRRAQIEHIGGGVEIIIATPGRLNDLVQANVIDVCTITYLVLDEADRMLDMGFEPQIRKVLLNIRPDRQTIMTSATWPSGVRRLAERYMQNPVQVCIGSLDLAAVHSVEQIIDIIDEEQKFERIMEFVKNMGPDDKVIIFCGKKARADDLSSEVSLSGIGCQCIHGGREQCDREQALQDIKDGFVKILIATDVASRGIDIGDITHVINYDFPRDIEEYVHRVGRTGRAGKTGTSISFFTRSDWSSAEELIKILEEADQEVPEELHKMKERFSAMKERREREKENFGIGGSGGGRRGGGFGGRSGGGFGGGRRYN